MGRASDWLKEISHTVQVTNEKQYPNLGSDTSSVLNFCPCFSDVILQGISMPSRNVGCFLERYTIKITGGNIRLTIEF